MSMTKAINPAGWNWDRPIAQMIKVSSRGLVGSDRSDFIKMAGATAPVFLNTLDNVKFAKDEVPVHLLAMGATEFWGPNRNGDGFKAANCKQYHDTFVKFARWYRNHKNKDVTQSYGVVKASAYSEAMHRIELLTALNATKAAADRNKGYIADKELEKLAKDEDIPVSMACRVPFDVCSGCDHRARTREEYCTAGTCKYGGCKDNLTKIAADGHILHVDNPTPSFFDISNVFRPADRTAYGTKADWLSKAASATEFVGGAELAEMLDVTAPLSVCLSQDEPWGWNTSIRGQVKLAAGLATLETNHYGNPAWLKSFNPVLQSAMSDAQLALLGQAGSEKSASALSALADRKVVLTLIDFARWTGREEATKVAADLLPGVYRRLAVSDGLYNRIVANPYACSTKTAGAGIRVLAQSLERTHSLSADAVRDRAMRSEVRQLASPGYKTAFASYEKTASDVPDAVALAEDYGLYKLAALHRIAATDQQFHLTASLAIAQNRVM